MKWALRIVAAMFMLAASMGQAQAPPVKLALVIGVGAYGADREAQEAAGFIVPPALPNAVHDAVTVADALRAQGFRVAPVVENPDKRTMLAAVNAFAAELKRAGPEAIGVFYFAGHGAQGRPALERDIDNYLIPVGADLATEVDLESEALALSRVSATLRPAPRGAVVLILDACRNFALPASNRTTLVTRGLAEARAAPGTLIAYSTSPGSTALDGSPGAGGPYANALAVELRDAKGASLTDLFNAVRNRVLSDTRETQTPWENSSLRRAVTIGIAPPPQVVTVVAPPEPLKIAPNAPTTPGTVFRDEGCTQCPEMVVIPAGSFLMGRDPSVQTPEWSRERGLSGYSRVEGYNATPQRTVTIARPFALGKYEVTIAEYELCVEDGGCRDIGERGGPDPDRPRRPITNLTKDHALRYIAWLNRQVGGSLYRLPTEAEWEYAARGQTNGTRDDLYPWGSTITHEQANYGKDSKEAGGLARGRDRWLQSAPVGMFPENAFKLNDMHGNVEEMVQDCEGDYRTAPRDGSENIQLECKNYVVRGGSYYDSGFELRSAARGRFWKDGSLSRSGFAGFRVARTIDNRAAPPQP